MNTALVALVGAAGATSGRMLLAHLAGRIVASRLVGRAMRDNLESVAEVIQEQRSKSIGIFFLFAFSPLPSNILFLSYGLTRAPLRLLAIPFFIGRCASYAVLFAGAAMLSGYSGSTMADWGGWLWAWFVLGQVGLLGSVYAFAKIDWRRTIKERRLRWTA